MGDHHLQVGHPAATQPSERAELLERYCGRSKFEISECLPLQCQVKQVRLSLDPFHYIHSKGGVKCGKKVFRPVWEMCGEIRLLRRRCVMEVTMHEIPWSVCNDATDVGPIRSNFAASERLFPVPSLSPSLPIEIPLSEPYLLWRISSPLSRARPPSSFLLDVLARRVIVTWPDGRDGRGRHYLLPFQSLLEKNSGNAFVQRFQSHSLKFQFVSSIRVWFTPESFSDQLQTPFFLVHASRFNICPLLLSFDRIFNVV